MKISASMDLQALNALMRTTVSRGTGVQSASLAEAESMRDYLVRDFPEHDTNDVDGGRWHTLCCVVEHEHSALAE